MATLTYFDTHVVAWLYAGRVDLFSRRAATAIEDGELLISPMVTLELQYLQGTVSAPASGRRQPASGSMRRTPGIFVNRWS